MFENGQLTVLNIKDILPNRFQPRIRFDGEKLEELAESIGKYGVIQPIVVRPVSNKFEIIAGERRYKASKLANKSTIPAIIVNLSDKDSEEIALLENIQRQELSPIEEAVSYKRILDMGYITQEELARKLGKAQSTIANKIRLLNLDDEVQSYLLNNKISERHARSLLRIPDKEQQVDMLHRIVEERLTVKQTDKEIEKLKENMKETQNVVKPVVLNVAPQNNNVSVINNTSEEIESLFDETDDMKSVMTRQFVNNGKYKTLLVFNNNKNILGLSSENIKEIPKEETKEIEKIKSEPELEIKETKAKNPMSIFISLSGKEKETYKGMYLPISEETQVFIPKQLYRKNDKKIELLNNQSNQANMSEYKVNTNENTKKWSARLTLDEFYKKYFRIYEVQREKEVMA